MNAWTIVAFFFAVSLSGLACGQGSGGACPGSTTAPPTEQACVTCVEQSCASQFAAAFGGGWTSDDFSGGACAGILSCGQSCGCNEACVSSCLQGALTASCEQALAATGMCEQAHCTAQCTTAPGTAK